MIRFACPGCQATYSVGYEKAGKRSRCPKCQVEFRVPSLDAVPQTPPPPPPPAAAAPAVEDEVEIAPCPGCQSRLMVAVSDLGAEVECPHCQTVYKAMRSAPGRHVASPHEEEEEDDRPSRRRRPRDDEEDDEDDRPSRRRRAVRDEDDEDEEGERPRRSSKRRRSRRDYEPHRGTTILILGILSLVMCGLFTAIPAWIMGNADLRKMDAGRMDPSGRGITQAGRIIGMIVCILTAFAFVGYCILGGIIAAGGGGAK